MQEQLKFIINDAYVTNNVMFNAFLSYGFHIFILNVYSKVYITYHYMGDLSHVKKMYETSSIHFACD